MKLTKREITLLFLLAAVFIAFIGIRFFILPEYQSYRDKLLSAADLTAQLGTAKANNGQKDTAAAQLTAEKEKYAELSKPFGNSIDQEQVYYWLSGLLKQNNLSIYSTEFENSGTTVVDFNTEKAQAPEQQAQTALQAAADAIRGLQDAGQVAQQEQTAQNSSTGQEALCTQITLGFTGSYSDTERFFDALYSGGRSLVVTNISIGEGEDKNSKMVIMTIQFLGVPLLDETKTENLDLPQPQGREELMAQNETNETPAATADAQATPAE